MPDRIRGISKTSLWKAWKAIRKELKRSSFRDVVDFLEYDIDPEVWIRRLLKQIQAGTYEPRTPVRYTVAKSLGFSRRMTLPAIPDLVLYRAIVDHLYRVAKKREHKHVYFEVSSLSKVRKQVIASANKHMKTIGSIYALKTVSTFLAWLHYNQYRKYLIHNQIYPFIVTTDITNFFDSILYSRVAESLFGPPTPPRMVGLLFFILERLSIRDAYTESPRIGLPVDEFNCSRKLAHIILFPHDDRVIDLVGEDAYVRWMDDQNIGVGSRSEGLKVLSLVGESLSRIHLSPNTQKTKVLSLNEARRHFHLDINNMLDSAESMPWQSHNERKTLRVEIRRIWSIAKKYEGKGEWDKLLKRFYRLTALGQSKMLRQRSVTDILKNPGLTNRVAAYMRCTGTVTEYLKFIERVIYHKEQIYPDVNLTIFENVLRLKAAQSERSQIRHLASELLKSKLRITGASMCLTIAPLIILRFGDRRSLPLLRKCLEKTVMSFPPWGLRAAGVVYGSYGIDEYRNFKKVAGKLGSPHLTDMVRFFERVMRYTVVPGSYKARLNLRYDAVAGREFIDMRSLVAARILSLNPKTSVKSWLEAEKKWLLQTSISQYDKSLIKRLLP
jgi:hypothetical protein